MVDSKFIFIMLRYLAKVILFIELLQNVFP